MSRSASPLLTYDDLARLPDDGKRREIIGGELFVNAAPRVRHQFVVLALAAQLRQAVHLSGRGQVFVAPLDVELSPHDVVEPDVIVVLNDRAGIVQETRIVGAPSLLIEVLSPSTARVDRGPKKRLFERSGVPEYWLVDCDRNVLEPFVLEGARYRAGAACTERVRLAGCPEVELELNAVWS